MPLEVALIRDGAPRWPLGRRSAAVAVGPLRVTYRGWCASHEGFDGKSPVYVRELYPYRLQPHPSSSSQLTMCAMRAIAHLFSVGGSMTKPTPRGSRPWLVVITISATLALRSATDTTHHSLIVTGIETRPRQS